MLEGAQRHPQPQLVSNEALKGLGQSTHVGQVFFCLVRLSQLIAVGHR